MCLYSAEHLTHEARQGEELVCEYHNRRKVFSNPEGGRSPVACLAPETVCHMTGIPETVREAHRVGAEARVTFRTMQTKRSGHIKVDAFETEDGKTFDLRELAVGKTRLKVLALPGQKVPEPQFSPPMQSIMPKTSAKPRQRTVSREKELVAC